MMLEERSRSLYGRVVAGPACLVILAAVAMPVAAPADTVLTERDVFRFLNVAVSHYVQNEERWTVEAACYFDPQVEDSMSCPWRTGGGGADPHRLRQRVKQDGIKWCKKNGGKSCTLLWRNGKLVFDSLSPEDSAKVESIVQNIPSYESEAVPLPEGVEVSGRLRGRFAQIREFWKDRKKKRSSRKPHYAVCASDAGPWSTSYQESGQTQTKAEGLRSVRRMCMLKCRAAMEWFGHNGDCYLVFEDGKFASEAARKAVTE